MYGTHTITDVSLGARYALRSEDEGLLDSYVGQRVTVHGTLVPGYENGQVEGGYPEVARMVHGHPTQSEAIMEAAEGVHKMMIHAANR
jgi:hypothetical protein